MPYARSGPHQVFYARLRGASPCGCRLVLVHGAGGTHGHWMSMVRHLGVADCYVPDLPGHGRSDGPGHRSIDRYAASVVGLMDALQLDRAVVAGHSMGGATAITMALACPERVAGLICVGTGARLRVLPSIMDGALQNFRETVTSICGYAYGASSPPAMVHEGERQMMQIDPRVLHGDFAACDAFDVMDSLSNIRAPTLVICGTEDRLTPPKYSRFLAERVSGAELCWIEGAGHMAMLEKPMQVAEAVRSALADWSA